MAEWRSRIVGSGEESPDQLLANPYNFRVHGRLQQEALAGVLSEVGWVQQVLVNRRTGHLIDGHLRVTLALRRNEPAVPVLYVDLDEAEERLVLATLDPIAALAQTDAQKLDELLREVSTGEGAVQQMLSELAENAGLYSGAERRAGNGGDDFDVEAAAQEAGICQAGDLWQLGEHRLIVGDATDPATVERLMRGERAEMMVTDPPYGVEYDPTWRDSFRPPAIMRGEVTNDSCADWSDAYKLFAGEIVYVWHAARFVVDVARGLIDCGFELRAQIIWAKQHFVLSRGAYHWQHEPCWYGIRRGGTARWCGGRDQSTVWQITNLLSAGSGGTENKTWHGTQKPVECMARPIRNHDVEIVYDPFGGSGTTLIACEREGRKCRMIEIEPKYADLILSRYRAETGNEPVLLERLGG